MELLCAFEADVQVRVEAGADSLGYEVDIALQEEEFCRAVHWVRSAAF